MDIVSIIVGLFAFALLCLCCSYFEFDRRHVKPNSEESTAPVFVGTSAQGVRYPESFSSNFFNKKRSLTSLPDNFHTFINDTIILPS